jgi:MoaA/NifB/PqqE/SkfB family radical SAM enzyme
MNTRSSSISQILRQSQEAFSLYQRVRAYLPRNRFRQFYRAWVVNNYVQGSARRHAFEVRTGCALPASLLVSPTHRCNLSCAGCYAAGYDQTRDMSSEQLDALITEAASLGIFSITLLGGEPCLIPNLTDLFRRHPDTAFRISTNGTLLDEAVIAGLQEAGNVVVTISLEGFEEETDSWRGAGTYRQVRQTMARLQMERLLYGFSVVLHQNNKQIVTSRHFLRTMQDAGNIFGLFFPYGPVGRGPREDLVIPEPDLTAIYSDLIAQRRGYQMLLMPEGYYSPDESQHALWNRGCQAGSSVHITPEGYVEPCNGIQFFAGNVFARSLESILTSGFYRNIAACARAHKGSCLAIRHPWQLLALIEAHQAYASNCGALPALRRHAAASSSHQSNKPPVSMEDSACVS